MEQKHASDKVGFLQSIKGKVMMMSILAILASVILGVAGLSALSKNDANNNVLSKINDISLLQYQNQSLETSYLYSLEDSYLGNILDNLTQMEDNASQAAALSSGKQKQNIKDMQTSISEFKDNQQQIRSLCSERGFQETDGSYQKFMENDTVMAPEFESLNNSSWTDGKWIDLFSSGTVESNGTTYTKMTYDADIPQPGKRDNFLARIGGNGMIYSGNIYLANLTFSGDSTASIDIANMDIDSLSGSYGSALGTISHDTIDGTDALMITTNYTGADGGWEEISLKIPLGELNNMDYSHVSFDLYFEDPSPVFSIACAFDGMYNFTNKLDELNNSFASYSKHVVEGKDVSEEAASISSLLDEMITAASSYCTDETQQSTIVTALTAKKDAYTAANSDDQQILELKKENIQLSQALTEQSGLAKDTINESTAAAKSSLTATIFIILLISAVLLIIITIVVNRSMNQSIRNFRKTLEEITAGNLTVRAKDSGKDEFSAFGKSLNTFLEKLSGIIQNAQEVSTNVSASGEKLNVMSADSSNTSYEIQRAVDDISKGAVSQASDIEEAATSISDMANSFDKIVSNIGHLNEVTEEMRQMAVDSSTFMTELAGSNQHTAQAFEQVAQQIHITNESVQKIHDAADFITSIANQTSLLSLNASIEAARAGEAGRGFAVVASEIQKLSEQSNASASNIESIITELSSEAAKTVDIIDTVSETVKDQQDKLNSAQQQFIELEQRVRETSNSTDEIRDYTSVCDDARQKVEGVIQNLSSISEENAASTEETTASMTQLNETIKHLATEAELLKESADQLKNNLEFFNL